MERMITSRLDANSIIGRLKLWFPDRPGEVLELRNLVTYQGADVIAGALAGLADYRLSAIWFEYSNAGSPAPITPARADTAASVQAEATIPAQRDIKLGLLVASPVLTSSGANYAANKGTYHALTSGTDGLLHGASVPFGSSSKIIGVSLVALPASGPLVYARAAVSPILPVGSSAQVASAWSTEIV
ncbi:MAG TPA: hypothetical protein PLS53_00435 [Thermoanaerobaculaceae bacterium]|nr:hypothetical protein [Thermoanaerobaculaceae bacterium]